MRRILLGLLLLCGCVFAMACAAPVEVDAAVTNEPSLAPLDSGGGVCGSGNHVCFVGGAQGSCLADGSCCLGCVDARGGCQNGTLAATCGGGGNACTDCITVSLGNDCFNHGCSPICSTIATCNVYCEGKPDGVPCDYCGGDGYCSGSACKQVIGPVNISCNP